MKKIIMLLLVMLTLLTANDTQEVTIRMNVPECSKFKESLRERCISDYISSTRTYLSVPDLGVGKSIIEITKQDQIVNLPLFGGIITPIVLVNNVVKLYKTNVHFILAYKVDGLYKTTFHTGKRYAGKVKKLVITPEYKLSRKTNIYINIDRVFDLPVENTNYINPKNINATVYFEDGKKAKAIISLERGKIRLDMVNGITQKDGSNPPAKYNFWMINNMPTKVVFHDNVGKKHILSLFPDIKTFGFKKSTTIVAKIFK